MESLRVPPLELVLGCALVLALSACTSSGCEDFDPQSGPLPVGSATQIEVEVVDGRLWAFVDVNGGYYTQPHVSVPLEQGGGNTIPSPRLSSPPGQRQATVLSTGEGLMMTVDGQTFPLEGPLGCE